MPDKGFKGGMLHMKMSIRQVFFLMILFTLIFSFLPVSVSANSAEPPSLVILVNNPPDDLSITMVSNQHQPEAITRRVAWEGYYVFYSNDMKVNSEYTFKVTTGSKSFECSLDAPLNQYNNVFTLDISKRALTNGTYPFRSAILVLIRLILTLLIEGIIFWLFQFRSKRSWIVFFIINIVTQGILNIWLVSGTSLMPSYLILGLVFGEFFVFTVEMVGFNFLIKERKPSYRLLYAFMANFISLIAGGYLITVLPV